MTKTPPMKPGFLAWNHEPKSVTPVANKPIEVGAGQLELMMYDMLLEKFGGYEPIPQIPPDFGSNFGIDWAYEEKEKK
jgi:hypothetical protein